MQALMAASQARKERSILSGNLKGLTFYLTERCNFGCVYCYQKRGQASLRWGEIRAAADLLPNLVEAPLEVCFYGGEPLLEFPLIRRAVDYLGSLYGIGSDVHFTLTTNGSLLSDEIIAFFEKKGFTILVSYDGKTFHERQRKGRTAGAAVRALKKLIKHPRIDLQTVSVFTPASVGSLSDSLREISGLGVQNIHCACDNGQEWTDTDIQNLDNQLRKLIHWLHRQGVGRDETPFSAFSKDNGHGVSTCSGGKSGLTLVPGGDIWGCHLLYDYWKTLSGEERRRAYDRYRLGRIEDICWEEHPGMEAKRGNYGRLSKDRCFTDREMCRLCADLMHCRTCPVNASFFGEKLGHIPDHVCRISRVFIKAREEWWRTARGDVSG
jgi:sulfatase maturation enzyme AslB (radical SAM superfamily)